VANATVTVYVTGTLTLAPLFVDDGITPGSNPVFTNNLGVFNFYVADGRYDIQVSGPNISTFVQKNVEISDVTEAGPGTGDLPWQTDLIDFVNQSAVPPVPPAGTVDLYTLASNRHIYIQDSTGTITDLTATGGGGGVSSLNGLTGALNIVGGSGIAISTGGSSVQVSATGGGGGGSPAGPVGTVQVTNSSLNGFAASSINDNGTVVSIAEEVEFRGPDPYTDVRQFGVRATASNTVPAIPGITATINAGSSLASLSSASSFQNGDGVVIYGAGSALVITPPAGTAITPSLAAAGTGTGLVVPANTGATTYNYQIVARDVVGGLTAASAVASIGNGIPLGKNSIGITGFSRSGTTVTVNTSSAHSLVAGAMVYISGSSDNLNFGGWYVVGTVPDALHFTYITGMDVANGASTSGTGGTAVWFSCNHVTWTPVPGAFTYYIYGRTGGSLTLLGASRPQNPGQGLIDATWDDFGSPMMDGITQPFFVPSTPPVSTLNDPLVAIIVSGAGTPTLTLSATASTAVAGAPILFDNTPNIQTAAARTVQSGLLYFPGGTYVTNSFLTIPGGVAVSLAGASLVLNDTMQIGNGDRFYGNLGAQGNSGPQFSWPQGGIIIAAKANPGVWAINGGGVILDGINLQGSANGQLLMALDGGGGSSQNQFKNTNFSDGGSGDYMGVNLLARGGFWNKFDTVTFATGPGQQGGGFTGSTCTPAALFNSGSTTFRNMSVQDRGIFFIPGAAGANVEFTGTSRAQGIITPFFMTYGLNAGGYFSFSDVELDTTFQALFANLSPNTTGLSFPTVAIVPGINGGTGGGFGTLTGKPIGSSPGTGLVLGPVSGQNVNLVYGFNFSNNPANVTGTGAFQYPVSVSGAPGAIVSAGGNVGIGNLSYIVTYIDINGRESTASAFTNVSTTPGNQTVTITPPPAPPGAVAWRPWRCNPNGLNCNEVNLGPCHQASLTFAQNYVDSFSFVCDSLNPPVVNYAGASSISQFGVTGTNFNVVGGGFFSQMTGTFTGNRTIMLPDSNAILVGLSTFATLNPAIPLSLCADCTIANPCAGGGTGALAKRLGGTWVCN
jgi:hypothetical protein